MQTDGETPRIVTKSAYAALRGCTPAYVSKLISQRKLRPPALTEFGQVDVALANAMLGAPAPQIQPGASAPPPPDDPKDAAYAEARRRREVANAEKAEVELAELNGRLVDRAAVEREIAEQISRLRDAMLMVPREIAAQCAALDDERAIEALATLAIKRALTTMARQAELENAA